LSQKVLVRVKVVIEDETTELRGPDVNWAVVVIENQE
jgi:hypothetical protein